MGPAVANDVRIGRLTWNKAWLKKTVKEPVNSTAMKAKESKHVQARCT
jgi:hypothetical protein